MATNYRLKVVRGDTQFEAEGDKAFVLSMADRLGWLGTAEHAPRIGKSMHQKDTQSSEAPSAKRVSVREFIQNLALKKHTDIVLAFGFYLEQNMGKPAFTPADINNLYYEAKLEPSNTSQACIQNIRLGRMMESKTGKSKSRKVYTLTSTGESFIRKKQPTS